MKHLLSIAELSQGDILKVFRLARKLKNGYRPKFAKATGAYSFEGNSLRTRATFLKAMASLGLTAIELPNLLKTKEDKRHLAGYLDQWIDLYVIRESNHAAIEKFAHASRRPVVNAMSGQGHPCEVLSDAFFLWERFGGLQRLKACLVGPDTNVLRSWRELCELFKMKYVQVMPKKGKGPRGGREVHSLAEGMRGADVVLTDSWPEGQFKPEYQVTLDKLQLASRRALVIPCPPFDETREVHPEVVASKYFAGYGQKRGLYIVHKAILTSLLG
jgi:ornithine carbamoyltransferase